MIATTKTAVSGCVVCGKSARQFKGGTVSKFCSPECRLEQNKQESAKRLFREDRNCGFCQKRYTAKTRDGKFCSKTCSIADRHKDNHTRILRICKGCRVEFRKNSKNNKGLYCSRECAFKHAPSFRRGDAGRDIRAARAISNGMVTWLKSARKQQKQCRQCGTWMMIAESRGKSYCESCAVERVIATDKACRAKRRARKRTNGPYETIRHTEVFTRDGWTCHICGRLVNRYAAVPHSRAPTIDHVIPLSKGGTHTLSNVKCACFICNARKTDKV